MKILEFINDLRWVPRIINKLEIFREAFVDPNWLWFINLMLENANVPKKYRYMFFPIDAWAVFLDCGMNVWLITDIARKMDMEVYWFEPNPVAISLLNRKYKDDKLVHIYPYAVSNEEWEMNFYYDPKQLFDQWATIVKEQAEIEEGGIRKNNSVKVPVKKLTDIIKSDILTKHKKIHLLKIDIEGSEFWVLEDIINQRLYKEITYIVVETHERFFKDWKKKLNDLKQKIKENNINNIYLDWI